MLSLLRQSTRLFLTSLALLAVAKHGYPQTSSQTLKEVFAAMSLPTSTAKLPNLEKRITSGAEFNDANEFAIAYYLDDGTGSLNPPLFVDRYNKKNKEWQSAALPDAQTKSPSLDDVCFGAVLNIKASGGRLLLDTHINPSAGCLLVLSRDLKLEASLSGRFVGQLGSDLLIYERSQVHFAPVHPTEIAVYDLRGKRDETIFPPKTATTIRRARTAQLREFYKSNPEWCQKNNDPCDPEAFDSGLQGPVVTSESDSVAAFLISYEQIQFVQGDLQKPSGPKDVLYVYRRLDDPAKMESREMLWGDTKTEFGNVPLQDLLQPQFLQRIFAEGPAKNP